MENTTNTMENPSEFDGLAKLRPGEPYFALLGRDMFSPALLMIWADFTRNRTLQRFDAGEIDEAKRADKLRQCRDAECLAWEMEVYRDGTQPVVVVEDRRPKVALTNLPPEQIARDAEVKARVEAVRVFHNAIAQMNDTAAAIAAYEPDIAAATEGALAMVRALAEMVKPHRPVLEARQDDAPEPIEPELVGNPVGGWMEDPEHDIPDGAIIDVKMDIDPDLGSGLAV